MLKIYTRNNISADKNIEDFPWNNYFESQKVTKYFDDSDIEIVEDIEGKKKALTILMKTQTKKDFEFTDKMVGGVTVIKINVNDYTAKRRPMPNGRKAME